MTFLRSLFLFDDKSHLVKLLKQGKQIIADWDAGGDQTLCNVLIDGSYNQESEMIAKKIIDKLYLPNASENYHRGKGMITLDEEENVVLDFSSQENTYAEELRESAFFPFEDPANLVSYLHKCDISILVEWCPDQDLYVDISVHMIYGDSIQIEDSQLAFYESQVVNFLQDKIVQTQKQVKSGQALTGVYVTGLLTKDQFMYLQIDKVYDHIILHHNERVILF